MGRVAQLVEQLPLKESVVRSIRTGLTKNKVHTEGTEVFILDKDQTDWSKPKG